MIWTRPKLGATRHRCIFCWFPLQITSPPEASNRYIVWLRNAWVKEIYQTVGTHTDTTDCWCIVHSQLYEYSDKELEV